MKIVRLPKGQTQARLVVTRSGDQIHAIISVKGPMQGASESRDFESVERAEAHAIDFAERRRADVLCIEDRT